MAANLSIVIPSHSRIDLLSACLKSVIRHAPRETEILVVDDGSAKSCVQTSAKQFPKVNCLRLLNQLGFAGAANAGIRAATNPIVELLNDDTEVTSGWAEPALDLFRDARIASVAPLVLQWPGLKASVPRIDSAGDHYHFVGIAKKRFNGKPLDQAKLTRKRVFGASASSAFYRRDAVLAVGGFAESFGSYFEDVDLACRLNHAGYRAVFEPSSQVLHHIGATHGAPHGKLVEQQSRNEERLFWRNTPSALLGGVLPIHLSVVFAKALRRWREGSLSPFIRGRLALLQEISEIRQHRKTMRLAQQHRRA